MLFVRKKASNAVAALRRELDEKEAALAEREKENRLLREQIRLLRHELFGRRSERRSPEGDAQSRLFDEAEAHSSVEKKTSVRGHSRVRKRGRKSPSPALRREVIMHDLPEEKKEGRRLIGEDVCEKVVVVPEDVYVERHVYPKYALPEGVEIEGEPAVIAAPRTPTLFPKSIATAAFVAYMLTAKFCDGLPFHRLEKIFRRWGLEIGRSTMCNWAIHVAGRSRRLMELMWERARESSEVVGCDETPLQVLGEEGRKNAQKSYMFVIRAGPPEKPMIFYIYRETRSAGFLEERLRGFRAALITDGHESYNSLAARLGIAHAGCMDHVRRRFIDAEKVMESSSSIRAAVRLFRNLYKIEREAREGRLSPEDVRILRQKKASRRLAYFKKWLNRKFVSVPEETKFGEAVKYALNQWPKITTYLENGNIPISNILVENAVRPFVIGRNNWLFSGSPRGADASALLYSLVETAKANGLEPYWFLRYLFEKLPFASDDAELSKLLPTVVTAQEISSFFSAQKIVAHPEYKTPPKF